MISLHNQHFSSLNEDQILAYERIVEDVNKETCTMFFVDGYGGTDKTFMWNVLSYRFRSEGLIVLNVASSGIATLLLLGGRTTHSKFGIPMTLTEVSFCRMKKNNHKAQLLRRASLIIWDETPMINRFAIEAFDRSLRDIIKLTSEGEHASHLVERQLFLGVIFVRYYRLFLEALVRILLTQVSIQCFYGQIVKC